MGDADGGGGKGERRRTAYAHTRIYIYIPTADDRRGSIHTYPASTDELLPYCINTYVPIHMNVCIVICICPCKQAMGFGQSIDAHTHSPGDAELS